jgi:hypothetical protein
MMFSPVLAFGVGEKAPLVPLLRAFFSNKLAYDNYTILGRLLGALYRESTRYHAAPSALVHSSGNDPGTFDRFFLAMLCPWVAPCMLSLPAFYQILLA